MLPPNNLDKSFTDDRRACFSSVEGASEAAPDPAGPGGAGGGKEPTEAFLGCKGSPIGTGAGVAPALYLPDNRAMRSLMDIPAVGADEADETGGPGGDGAGAGGEDGDEDADDDFLRRTSPRMVRKYLA